MMRIAWAGTIRRYVAVISSSIALGGTWGTLAAYGSRFVLDIDELQSLIFVGLPVALLVVAFMWKKLPRILGFELK